MPNPPRQPDGRRPPLIPPFFVALDTDRDMVLSAEEISAASQALGKLDQNEDGEITLNELRMPPPDGEKDRLESMHKPPVPPVIAAMDSDEDGTLSSTELENAPESLKVLDKDGDGELSPEELRPNKRPPGAPDGDAEEHPQAPPPGEEGELEGVE